MLSLFCLAQFEPQRPQAAAETARWIVHNVDWGYLSTISDAKKPAAEVVSLSDSGGRIFFYLMSSESNFDAALTVGEAAFAGTCGFAGSKIDPEDPRCAKITVSGSLAKSAGKDIETGKVALFARHPQMQKWPEAHGFVVFEMHITDIWMIDFYGGGSSVMLDLWEKAVPKNNRPKWAQLKRAQAHTADDGMRKWSPTKETSGEHAGDGPPPPPYAQYAARARWLVAHATWTAVSTVSVQRKGAPWGNVRSIADPIISTGLPYFYLPSPDPTAVDVNANNHITLSFTEAALLERAGPNGTKTCGDMDAEDPTCARLFLSGTAVAITSNDTLKLAEAALKAKHPLAPWLAQGGAHTGGNYYSIQLDSLKFLDFYGGFANLSVADYLAHKPGLA